MPEWLTTDSGFWVVLALALGGVAIYALLRNSAHRETAEAAVEVADVLHRDIENSLMRLRVLADLLEEYPDGVRSRFLLPTLRQAIADLEGSPELVNPRKLIAVPTPRTEGDDG